MREALRVGDMRAGRGYGVRITDIAASLRFEYLIWLDGLSVAHGTRTRPQPKGTARGSTRRGEGLRRFIPRFLRSQA